MKHTEQEMLALKEEVRQMWRLTLSQLEKAKAAFLNSNIETALEVMSREKRLDAFDLKIDSDCENYIALYSPVAIDLRLVLSLIKISNTLERIGDFAVGIAKHVIDNDCSDVDPKILDELQVEQMFDILIGMLSDSYVILESENTKVSGKILAQDEAVDAIYHNALESLAEEIRKRPDFARCALKLFLLVRKMERIGDHCSNIVEELVFYVDAKVLKHSGQKFPEE
ncbi:PhoU family transcriptional regulator [Porphyromonas sp. COT-108 OH2963]|uniref:phosphate signaling complex protein PhoU n=1 Tax=Porphyromonas sp. COT-108 OH2963 TaxID=1515614 RepID=UPI00052D5BCC|nr:phosphate signaling complex protein PhoU [Porphyromonas sp. COT-108 OH2963]KGN95583.1 PhoU family transcriptional regulator [Porphyromonas sp. COT-108 OH2963]